MKLPEAEGIEKRLDGLVAVDGVSFKESQREILGMLCPTVPGKDHCNLCDHGHHEAGRGCGAPQSGQCLGRAR